MISYCLLNKKFYESRLGDQMNSNISKKKKENLLRKISILKDFISTNARFGETFGYEFESLHCPECGGSLDNMDKNQELVKCKFCEEMFEKKALKS